MPLCAADMAIMSSKDIHRHGSIELDGVAGHFLISPRSVSTACGLPFIHEHDQGG